MTYSILHVDADGADVITAVDGRPVRTAEELARQLAGPPTSGLRLLTVLRGGKEVHSDSATRISGTP
jgi:S1-C subfamily serine protease